MAKWYPEELQDSYEHHKKDSSRKEAATQAHYHQGRVDAISKEPPEALSKVKRLHSAYLGGYVDEVPSVRTATKLEKQANKLDAEVAKRLPKNYGQGTDMTVHGEGKPYGSK